MTKSVTPVSSSHLEALLQLTAAGLDKDEDDDFISFHLKAVVKKFLQLVGEKQIKNIDVTSLALKCLINLITDASRCHVLHKMLHQNELMEKFIKNLCWIPLDRDSTLAGLAACLVCNLTRESGPLLEAIVATVDIENLVTAICQMDNFNPHVRTDKLPQVLLNFSQLASVRRGLCQPDHDLIGRLFTFTQLKYPLERRAAMAGLFKNCCFDDELHVHLMEHPDDFLSALMLPLCGPHDQLSDEEMLALPEGIQLVPGSPDTEREPDNEIRILLCGALLQLCSTSTARQRLRDLQIYAVLRELHKWERDRASILAVEHVVDVLIGDEPDTSELSQLRTVDVPDDVARRVENSNKVFLEEGEEDDGSKSVKRTSAIGGIPAIESGDAACN